MNRIQSPFTIPKHAPIAAAMFTVVLTFAGVANADAMYSAHADNGIGYVGVGAACYGGNAVGYEFAPSQMAASSAVVSTNVNAVAPAYVGGGEGYYGF